MTSMSRCAYKPPMSLISLNSNLKTEQNNKKREGRRGEQIQSSSGSVYRIYLAMSNQLSAFCGWMSGLKSMAASCWQGRAMCITCILQQARFVEGRTTTDSFQCLMKQMTWTLLYETLLCLSFLTAFFSCLWWLLLTSETCSTFGFPVAFLVRRRSFQCCSCCPVHWAENSICIL